VQTLAAAPLEEVLALWAGLGYYSRARHLHQAAQIVMERHGGIFPREFDDVLALPGVGRYTAGAVTSIAFDAPAPIVDANVARVFARLFCLEGDLKSADNQRRLWREAETLARTGAENGVLPSQLNPALMELGALVCVPGEPRCDACPVREFCAAFRAGRQNELPRSTPRAEPTPLHDVCAFAIRERGGEIEILLRQRPHEAKVWWRGLWELPRATVTDGETSAAALQRVLHEIGARGEPDGVLTTLTHGVTRYRITLDCYAVEYLQETPEFSGRWATWAQAQELAMPSSMRRLLAWLERHRHDARQLKLL
jgi:A/G-specific adenine glycosylase